MISLKSNIKKVFLIGLQTVTSLLSISTKYAIYLPLFFLVSIYLPIGIEIRSDFIVVYFTFFLTIFGLIVKGKSIFIERTVIYLLLFTMSHLISTLIFNQTEFIPNSTVNFSSLSEIHYWIRLILIIFIIRHININFIDFSKFFKIFYIISFFIVLLGLLESFRIMPKIYDKILGTFFFGTKSISLQTVYSTGDYSRSTSILAQPSIFAHFCLFFFWIALRTPKNIISNFIKWGAILVAILAGFGSNSKIFYVGLIGILFYEEIIVKRRIQYFIIFLGIIVSLVFLMFSVDKSILPAFAHNLVMRIEIIKSVGFYEVFLRTRFDENTGLLYQNYLLFKENWIFGVGVTRIPGLFYGDSFLLSNLLKTGIVGFSFFLLFVKNLYKRLNRLYKSEQNELKRNLIFVLRNFLILNLLFSIGINSFTFTRTSDMLFALIFICLLKDVNENKNQFS